METRAFVDAPKRREEVRTRLGIAPDEVVAGTIARLFDLKGHDDILEQAPKLCARFPKMKFLWVGDGTLRPRFEREMDQMNLRDRFMLTGMVPPDDVPQYVAAMDLLVHPSRREGLARALPQAQLAGVPVIAYDVDGNREGLIDQRTGFLVAPFDQEKLAETIELLARSSALRRQMGMAGRDFAMKRFDKRVMVRELERVYREAISLP
jgi:glycosyltransferase involved in cell wall biosynthesis